MVALFLFLKANNPILACKNLTFFLYAYLEVKMILAETFPSSLLNFTNQFTILFGDYPEQIHFWMISLWPLFKNYNILRLSWDNLWSQEKWAFFGVSMILFGSQWVIFGQKLLKIIFHCKVSENSSREMLEDLFFYLFRV